MSIAVVAVRADDLHDGSVRRIAAITRVRIVSVHWENLPAARAAKVNHGRAPITGRRDAFTTRVAAPPDDFDGRSRLRDPARFPMLKVPTNRRGIEMDDVELHARLDCAERTAAMAIAMLLGSKAAADHWTARTSEQVQRIHDRREMENPAVIAAHTAAWDAMLANVRLFAASREGG
jgi:hypothetical protein